MTFKTSINHTTLLQRSFFLPSCNITENRHSDEGKIQT